MQRTCRFGPSTLACSQHFPLIPSALRGTTECLDKSLITKQRVKYNHFLGAVIIGMNSNHAACENNLLINNGNEISRAVRAQSFGTDLHPFAVEMPEKSVMLKWAYLAIRSVFEANPMEIVRWLQVY